MKALCIFITMYIFLMPENSRCEEVNSFIDNVLQMNNKITSGTWSLTYNYTLNDSLNAQIERPNIRTLINNQYTFSFDGPKKYINEYDLNNKVTNLFSYDVEKSKRLISILASDGLIRSDGFIEDMLSFDQANCNLVFIMNYYFENAVYSMKENASHISNYSKEIINSIPCNVISFISEYDNIQSTFKIAPSLGYRPIIIEIEPLQVNDNELGSKEIFNFEYMLVDSLYFPKYINKNVYYYSNERNIHLYCTKEYIVHNCDLNINIPASQFDLDFPKGIRVRDHRIGRTYVNE